MRSSKNPTTSSKLPYIPPEILIQILPKLPAKTLLRFRCVCKSWHSIIDNPDFVHMHFQHSRINSENSISNKLLLAFEGMGCSGSVGCVLTVRDAQTLAKVDHIFRTHFEKYRIIGSCNGLLLVALYAPHGHLNELRLWNPCIRKSLIFPVCLLSSYLFRSHDWYVFGFSPDSQGYKVVGFDPNTLDVEDGKMYFAVYTLSNQQWTVRKDPLNVPILNRYNRRRLFDYVSTAVFFRGAVHWLGKIDNQRHAFTHLASFDFDHEKLTFLELPFTCEESGTLRFLFFLRGSLAVFSISEVTSSIWMLDLDNQKRPWTLWFSGKSTQDGYEAFELCSANLEKARLVNLTQEKEAKDRLTKVFYCESDGGYLVCGNKAYNIASGQVQPFKRYMSSHLKLEKYWENLVLFKGYGARDLRSFP
ncbi:putative F-box protein At5g47300 isoform X1 [Silene latifolia]|uniref:putative F-box protein At5g47300 isoform X1 n=1 Tax=Silene latifolia TaxID=37657 RepID=UPI003D78A127